MGKPVAAESPTPKQWRPAMGYFPSGVTIVTSWRKTAPVGATVSSFCSVSLEPPLLLICLDHANPALAPIESCRVLGVNILSAESRARMGDQASLSGSPSVAKYLCACGQVGIFDK